MSDVTPNYDLERQRIELEKDQFKLNIQSQKYRIAMILDEKRRIEENILATQEAIKEADNQLTGLRKDISDE